MAPERFQAVKKRTGLQPKVAAIHAGLECGVIMERIPGTVHVLHVRTYVRPQVRLKLVGVSALRVFRGGVA